MICDICKKDTYIIHINSKHQKVCKGCYVPNKKGFIDKWETNDKRYLKGYDK